MNKYNNRCTDILIPNYFIGHRFNVLIFYYYLILYLQRQKRNIFADNTGFEPVFPAYYAGVLDR